MTQIDEMMEGQQYPELRNARYYPIEMRRRTYGSLDWYLKDINGQAADTIREENIPAVRLELPLEDANALFEIYRAHYHAANRNPAVREAWLEYRTLVGLTQQY
jgi:hypothetical protein